MDIQKSADKARQILSEQFAARGNTLSRQASKARRHLPRNVRGAIKTLETEERNIRFTPYPSQQQRQRVAQAHAQLSAFSEEYDVADVKRTARRRWAAGLFLNLALFAVLLCGFWYVATQM